MTRRTKVVVLAGVMVAMVGMFSVPAMAQKTADPVTINVNLKDAELLTATRFLTKETGIQFIIEPSNEAYPKINLSIGPVTPDEAIEYICKAAGVGYRKDSRGVYMIGRSISKIDKPNVESPFVPPVKKPSIVRSIQLMRADAEYTYNLLLGRVMFDPMKGFEQLARFRDGATSFHPTGTKAVSENELMNSINQANVPVDTTSTISRPKSGLESGADLTLPLEAAPQGRGGGGQLGGGGLGGGLGGGGQLGGGGLGGGGLGGGGLGGGGGQISPSTSNFIPEGTQALTYDPATNSFIFQGDEEAYNLLSQRIAEFFDKAPKQVEVKVEFVTTKVGLLKSMGVDWQYVRGTTVFGSTPGLFADSSDPIFFNYSTGNVAARLRTGLGTNQSSLVTAPIIRTLNNQPAGVFQGTSFNVPIVQRSFVNGQIFTNVTYQPFQAFTGLFVTPRINFGDNTVTMFLSPQIQTITTQVDALGNTLINQNSQGVQVVARVKNNETMVLGGLVNKSDLRTANKFPILSDLPIIGSLFQGKKQTVDNTELLIFVTPKIIEDDTTGPSGGTGPP